MTPLFTCLAVITVSHGILCLEGETELNLKLDESEEELTEYLDQWEKFKLQFGRRYNSDEHELHRQSIFRQNLDIIRKHNAEYAAGKTTFLMGVNQFADLTNEEFQQQMMMMTSVRRESVGRSQLLPKAPGPRLLTDPPKSFDWRQQGVNFVVKDQGQIGAAWAMAVTSALEAGYNITNGVAIPRDASTANLVDCTSWASTSDALLYVQNKGIASAEDYPDITGSCNEDVPKYITTDATHNVPQGDETTMVTGLLANPVTVELDASHASFQFYSSGVYQEPRCSSQQVDHAMLAVGYGKQGGNKYWLLLNSWGSSWGKHGYMKMLRGENMCGVASYAVYPTGIHDV